ncbi:MAG: hypothetical protein MJ053_06405 [Elusimicrobiaceae bacterium]|nr:hypothetical protein [Elusimicrobiaceae bacterium]
MKLKKLLCTLVAVIATSVAFAGNTSNLKYLINQTFLQLERLEEVQEVSAEEQVLVDAATALRAGLLNYEAKLTAGEQLTEKNAEMDRLFGQLPAIFNQINQESEEQLTATVTKAMEDFLPVLNQLTNATLANQTSIGAGQVNSDVANALMGMFC